MFRDLYQLLASIRTEKEAEGLLSDFLTPKEINSLAKRWQILYELARGTKQRDVARKLRVGITTVTRGSRVLRQGTGEAWHFLQRLKKLQKPKK